MTVQTFIDGAEVTDVVLDGTSKHTLGKPYEATVKLPLDYAGTGLIGKLLKIVDTDLASPIDHHGRILNVSDNDDENSGTTEVTSYGPDEIWTWRPARDGAASGDAGDFSKPTFMTRVGTGPQIMEEILTQSADGSNQRYGEGDMKLLLNSFATGGVDLSGALTNWPMTIAEIRSVLQESGELDVIVTPIDSGGNIGRVDCYNGNYGTDLSGSVIFQYATGAGNVAKIRRTEDLTNACNKLQYFLGPKIDDQHWQDNLTGTDARAVVDGGPPDPPQTAILAARATSRTKYLVRMDIRMYDSFSREAYAKPLFWRLWQVESLLRQNAKTIVHVTPERGILPTFDIGDIIGVGAGSAFRGGFATAGQRVYDRTISWDTEGVVSIAEIQTSADQ